MPEIEHGFALNSVPASPNSLSLGGMAAGGTYLVIAAARVNGTIGPPNIYASRLDIGIGSEIRTLYSLANPEFRDHFGYMSVVTGATSMQFTQDAIAAGNASADEIALFYMRLDAALQAADWHFNEDDDSGAPTLLGPAFADFASITFTPANAGEDWLILTHTNGIYGAQVDDIETRINRDAGADVAPLVIRRSAMGAGATSDQQAWLLSRVYTLSAAPHTFTAQMRRTGIGPSAHHSSRIFALRLNAFRQHAFFWNEGALPGPVGFGYAEMADAGLEPFKQADFLILGEAIADYPAFQVAGARLELDGPNVIGQGESPPGFFVFPFQSQATISPTDENPLLTLDMENLAAVGHRVRLHYGDAGGAGEVEDRSLLLLSMDLPGEGDAVGVAGTMGPALVRTPHKMVGT